MLTDLFVEAVTSSRARVSCLEHAGAAQHFEALVVAVGGASSGVDLAEPAFASSNGYGSGVNIARLAYGRIHQTAPGGMDTDGFILENPTEEIEIVNEHVLVNPAGDLDVGHGRRAGVSAGDQQSLRFADFSSVETGFERRKGGIEAALKTDGGNFLEAVRNAFRPD